MGDKKPIARSAKTTRPSMNTTFAGRTTAAVPQTTAKDERVRSRKGSNRTQNQSVLEQSFAPLVAAESDCDLKIELNQLLSMLYMDDMMEETLAREQDQYHVMMAQLAKRCERNVALLDKTHKRLTEISFLGDKQRLLEMKNADCSKFLDQADPSKAEALLDELAQKERSYVDRVDTKNVDLGYSLETGYQQLVDAMEDVAQGFDNIRKESKFDPDEAEHYWKLNQTFTNIGGRMMDLADVKREFEAKFPNLSDRSLIRSSEQLAKKMEEQAVEESDAE